MRAGLRRVEESRAPLPVKSNGNRYLFAGWELNLQTRRLTSPTGASVEVTVGDFSLLITFLRSPQQVLSRERLITTTRRHEEEVYDRSIDVQILRLRRKLEIDPSAPVLIKTERAWATCLTLRCKFLDGRKSPRSFRPGSGVGRRPQRSN